MTFMTQNQLRPSDFKKYLIFWIMSYSLRQKQWYYQLQGHIYIFSKLYSHEVDLTNIQTFNSYLTENQLRLHCKDQTINAGEGNKRF
jgi:hypothetical protein